MKEASRLLCNRLVSAMPLREEKLRIYVDADVMVAALLSPSSHSAGQVILQLSEATIIDAITSERAVEEVRRNLLAQLGRRDASDLLDEAVSAALDVVANPPDAAVQACRGRAHDKDALHLASALEHDCSHLVTYNLSDYPPRHGTQQDAPAPSLEVLAPGPLVRRIRARLVGLS